MRRSLAALLVGLFAAGVIAGGTGPVAAQTAPAGDYFKQAGNFLANCDARKDETGNRPQENYLCLSFLAGMIEGYNYAAVANGNPRPYCLVRPTSLVEMMDMMAVVIERGVPPDMPTAAVFHFILEANFKCPEDGTAPQNADDTGATPAEEAPQ
ncbi:MAG: hypothetical protein AAGD34_18530 [Pseudomonadota bacterium]